MNERFDEWVDTLDVPRGTCSSGVGNSPWVDREGAERGRLVCTSSTEGPAERTITQFVWTGNRSRTVWALRAQTEIPTVFRRWNETIRPMTVQARVLERRLFELLGEILETDDCVRNQAWPLAIAEVYCDAPRAAGGRRLGVDYLDVAWTGGTRNASSLLDNYFWAFAEFAVENQEPCGDAHLGIERSSFGKLVCFPSGEREYLAWTVRRRPLFFLAMRTGLRARELVNAYEEELQYVW